MSAALKKSDQITWADLVDELKFTITPKDRALDDVPNMIHYTQDIIHNLQHYLHDKQRLDGNLLQASMVAQPNIIHGSFKTAELKEKDVEV